MTPHQKIHVRLAPLKSALLEHPIYARMDRLESLHTFMEHHVFAVWDFMSLLKALQQRLCCAVVPWLPPTNQLGCRLVSDIVLAEESDDDGEGGYISHFELYRLAMRRCGANTRAIDQVLEALRAGRCVTQALDEAHAPPAVQQFVAQTFKLIEDGDLCAIASAFTFGREHLLPAVFRQIVEKLSLDAADELQVFRYYLERHIDLDSDQHGPMSERLMDSLCSDSETNWRNAEEAAWQALESRLNLWNGIELALAN